MILSRLADHEAGYPVEIVVVGDEVHKLMTPHRCQNHCVVGQQAILNCHTRCVVQKLLIVSKGI